MTNCGALAAAAVPAGTPRLQLAEAQPGWMHGADHNSCMPRGNPPVVSTSASLAQRLGSLRGSRWQRRDPTGRSRLPAAGNPCSPDA